LIFCALLKKAKRFPQIPSILESHLLNPRITCAHILTDATLPQDVVVTAHAILLAKLVRRWITASRLKKQGILPAAGRHAMLGWVGEGAHNATVKEMINHPFADDSEDAKRSSSAC
jgi:hypothetical protein